MIYFDDQDYPEYEFTNGDLCESDFPPIDKDAQECCPWCGGSLCDRCT